MLGEHDNSNNKSGYLDIVSAMGRIGADFKTDAHKLFMRMVFNICVGNTDDHLRNHGFVLTDKGWRLSEAFDVNPSLTGNEQALLIDFTDNRKSLELALGVSEFFDYGYDEAVGIVRTIQEKVRSGLKYLPAKYGLTKSDVKLMESSFSESFADI